MKRMEIMKIVLLGCKMPANDLLLYFTNVGQAINSKLLKQCFDLKRCLRDHVFFEKKFWIIERAKHTSVQNFS